MPDGNNQQPPRWVLRPFRLRVPFRMSGELEYQSWDDLERKLSGDLTIGSLPELRFEFGQNLSRLQGGLGLQLWQTELPRIGPFITEVGVSAMMRWAEGQQLRFGTGIEVRHVRWRSFRFTLDGNMDLSGLNQNGRPTLGAEITGNIKFNFTLFAPGGTFIRIH